MSTLEFTGTGGVWEGSAGAADVVINQDSVYNFDNEDSQVLYVAQHADFNMTGDFTLSAWIKPNSSGGGGTSQWIMGKNGDTVTTGATHPYAMWYHQDNEKIIFTLSSEDGTSTASVDSGNNSIEPDEWNHVMITRQNGANDYIYINGVQKYGANAGVTITNSTQGVSIGAQRANDTGASYEFEGNIADVRVIGTMLDHVTRGRDYVDILSSKIGADISDLALTGGGATNYQTALWLLTNDSKADTGGSTNTHTLTESGTMGLTYDAFSVNCQGTGASAVTTTGTTTVTQGKLEGLSLTSAEFELDDGGDNIYASVDSSGFSKITVSAWVNFETLADARGGIVQCSDDGNWNDGYGLNQLSNASGTIGFWVSNYDTDAAEIDISEFSTGRWYHLVGTYDATNSKLYVDGVLKATAAKTWSNKAASDSKVRIGSGCGNGDTASHRFDGKVRDAKIWDSALSAEQVSSLYSGAYNATPTHWWKIDEGTGATATIEDYGTGTDADGTGVGLTWDNGALHFNNTLTIASTGTVSASSKKVPLLCS